MEVDHATNPTRLYESIQSTDWTSASRSIRLYPHEASTWVVRRQEDDELLWRFLPLHSALARSPPVSFVTELVDAYPAALGEKDVSGMLPLHYAVGNRCSMEIMEVLVGNNVETLWEVDGNGMTAFHYVGAYGCEDGVLEMMLRAANEIGDVGQLIEKKNSGGMTPLMLARERDYEGNDEVVRVLEQWLNGGNESDHKFGLQIITKSPRNAVLRSRSSPRSSSRGKTRFASSEVATSQAKTKNFHRVISPRHSGSQSGEYPIHMMDSKSPKSPRVYLATSTDTEERNDAPGRRSCTITTRSLEHSTTPIASNKGFESPRAVHNMKTPRSSGRGGRFFDHPPPSPRYPQSLTSPRGALLSPRAQPSQSPQTDLVAELQRLQLENDGLRQQLHTQHPDLQMLQMQNETLSIQSQQKDAENAELRAQLAEYQSHPAYDTAAARQSVETTTMRLKTLLTQLHQRESALTSIIKVAEQRENARLTSYTARKQELLKMLAAEENEKQRENGYMYEGLTIGGAFGRELRALQEVRDEVGRMLEELN